MKYLKIFSAVMVFLLAHQVILAQSDCDKIKAENDYLRKALKIVTPVKLITSSKIDFNLVSCKGNIKEQTVTVQLILTNHAANQEFQFSSATAVDIEGNEFKYNKIKLGSEGSRNKIYTDVPIKTLITFSMVLPSVKLMKLIAVEYYDDERPGRSIGFEYKDIPVEWN